MKHTFSDSALTLKENNWQVFLMRYGVFSIKQNSPFDTEKRNDSFNRFSHSKYVKMLARVKLARIEWTGFQGFSYYSSVPTCKGEVFSYFWVELPANTFNYCKRLTPKQPPPPFQYFLSFGIPISNLTHVKPQFLLFECEHMKAFAD